MKLSELFDFNANFHSERAIKKLIKRSAIYQGEDPEKAKLLNFFSTSKQRTYLVITDKAIYCILDNTKKEHLYLNWSENIDLFSDFDKLDKLIETRDATPSEGLVDFGPKYRNWYYTKALFQGKSIQQQIKDIVEEVLDK